VGENKGEVSKHHGLVGEYPGDVRLSAGDVGEYVGEVGPLKRKTERLCMETSQSVM
jgi:hypothetical protein